MAYELVQFSPLGDTPRFLKIMVVSTVAVALIIGLAFVKSSPPSFQDQRARDSAQERLEQSQRDLSQLKATKASGERWPISDITIDEAIADEQRTIGNYKAQLANFQADDNQKLKQKLKTGGIISVVLGIIIASIISSWMKGKSIYEGAKANLAERNYNPDFHIGNMFIDSRAKIIAFVDARSLTYDLYSTKDILNWEHQWIDKTEASTNVWGNNIRAKTRQTNNQLVLKTNNPAKPLYKVSLLDHRSGEEWMARLGAIING